MSDPQPRIEIVPIEALRPQAKNYRQHTPRNIAMIGDSIQAVGVMRSVVSDGDNADELVAGSGTLDAAMERGITQAIIVETDGTALLVHRRRGLTEEQKVRYSIEDNRATDLSGWDTVALAELADEMPALLDGLFHTEELAQILERAGAELLIPDPTPQKEPELKGECFIEIYCSQNDLEEFRATLTQWGGRKSVTVNIS